MPRSNDGCRMMWRVLAGLAIVAAAGCGTYRLGSTLPPGIKSVHVPTVINQTGEPRLDSDVTRATVERLQQDGTLRVAPAGEADSILHVTLKTLTLEPVRYDRNEVKAAAEYRLVIRAEVELKAANTGKVLATTAVAGESSFVSSGDLTTGKRSATPAAAEDLARRIVDSLVEYW